MLNSNMWHLWALPFTLLMVSILDTCLVQSRLINPAHQNPQVAPPIPITKISDAYNRRAGKSQLRERSSYHHFGRFEDIAPFDTPGLLSKRGPESCGPGAPCADGSCCNKSGICGYGPTYCGSGNCTANCDATAMCGKYSSTGSLPCGMNLCCSYYGWCGTDELHCINADPINQSGPCQQGMGLCKIVTPKRCGSNSGTSNGRTIGYYQASNVRDRPCNKITPAQINTKGLTHLYFAFAKFDPGSFSIVPDDPGDVSLYTQFTNLKSSSLKTWIAIGGFDFSDNGTSTHTAWSDMVSSPLNRANFISSLKSFMNQYGFQGVDLDWEYPGASDRGGKTTDTANFVQLVKEMRYSFGGAYGISLTLAPDYWYLRWFNAIQMQPYVDWFGFMAYDLHGSWDADVKTLGSIVRGQADIREIYNDTLPLWYDGLDPSKINFGVAYYGRGYTLSNPSCTTLGCPFSGPSKAAPCTNFPGVMSLIEIQTLISQKGIQPQLLAEAAMKQITWNNQWIGYDDAETIQMKKQFANDLCFGGTMAWSVDFNSGTGSGNTPQTTTDGTCGVANGGTICGDWKSGNCCSSSGYCGSSAGYCGSGCQSGNCIYGGETTDGKCGFSNNNANCGNWAAGPCCSSSGFCGNDTAHCGVGCQSGPCLDSGGSGDVYISPSIMTQPNPVVQCIPPCNLILPPITLTKATTISFPPITETLEIPISTVKTITSGGSPITTTVFTRSSTKTTILIPPLTTTRIPVSNIHITDSGITTATYTITASVLPPIVTITDGPPGSRLTQTITPTPWSSPVTRTTTTNVPPVAVTFHSGTPTPTCTSGCGTRCQYFCGTCGLKCIPGLDIGPPSLGCPLCGGSSGCRGPGCPGPSGGGDGDDDPEDCNATKTVGSACSVICSPTVTASRTTQTCQTTCTTQTMCDAVDHTTTTTITPRPNEPTPVIGSPDTFIEDPDAGDPMAQTFDSAMAAEDAADAAAASSSSTTSATPTATGYGSIEVHNDNIIESCGNSHCGGTCTTQTNPEITTYCQAPIWYATYKSPTNSHPAMVDCNATGSDPCWGRWQDAAGKSFHVEGNNVLDFGIANDGGYWGIINDHQGLCVAAQMPSGDDFAGDLSPYHKCFN